jgi:hypothetical protein
LASQSPTKLNLLLLQRRASRSAAQKMPSERISN